MGFFDLQDILDKSPAGCASCRRHRSCLSPKMTSVEGQGNKGLMILHEHPSEEEDETGSPFTGKNTACLETLFADLGIDMEEDCFHIYAAACGTKKPDNEQLRAHYPTVASAIKRVKPKVILALGDSFRSILFSNYKGAIKDFNRWRGFPVPLLDLNCWMVATFNPKFADEHWDDLYTTLLKQDLKTVVKCLETPLPEPVNTDDIEIVSNSGRAVELLEKLLKRQVPIAFDYETSGLKPQRKGHWIQCASFSPWPGNRSFCFRLGKHPDEKVLSKWCQVLGASKIGKVAHNVSFEDMWSRVVLKQRVAGWIGDTILLAHIEDNRSGIVSLKFQSFLRFGIHGYEKEIKPFIEAEYPNDFNKVDKAPQKALMSYCGMDSLLTMRLFARFRQLGLV